MKQEPFKQAGEVEIYGYTSNQCLNRANALPFNHSETPVTVYAKVIEPWTIQIQAELPAQGLEAAIEEYSYETAPSVREFYGAVKRFIEKHLRFDYLENLSRLEQEVVKEVARQKNHDYAETLADLTRDPHAGSFYELTQNKEKGFTIDNAPELADEAIQHLEDYAADLGLEGEVRTSSGREGERENTRCT
ncbi:hypothetical protein OB919_16115 [Halobacteria archaeon AArc-curdl1]|uniref:Uncharacterized protein n=1 Tax=Natronosalvus hydrolyticus TaxID=2979988 RepID=A0AAP3E7C9_9EURY|nr:hypothetical protein [Halobacteria archaeon AArc-curdl1]